MLARGIVVISDTGGPAGCTCGNSVPAALECVANRPIAHHVLEALISAGVEEVVIVGARNALMEVRRSFSHHKPIPLEVSYAISGDNGNPVAAVQVAAPLVGASPCVVHLGEGLLDEPLRAHLESLEEGSPDVVLLRGAAPAWSSLQGPGRSRESVPAPASGDAGVAVFGPRVLGSAGRLNGAVHAASLDSLGRSLSDAGRNVEVRETEGWHRYDGQPSDLLELNRLALDALSPSSRLPQSDNRIVGKVQIDPAASVTSSLLIGPVAIAEGARVSNAYIGPYTSIGARARIDGAEIERSIIAPGATVLHVGARLVSSLVGRRAQVFRDFSLPRAMRLQVGEGDEVALC